MLLGISTLFLYVLMLLCTGIVVGTIVGQWILGRTNDFWPLAGRMALGVLLVRIVTSIPFIGSLGEAGRRSVGHGRDFPGGLPAAAARGRSQYSVSANHTAARQPASAKYHGRRHVILR